MTVEELWVNYQTMRADPEGKCPCGCSWNGKLWLLSEAPYTVVWEHTSKTWEVAAENDWRHYSAGWRHDGKNPYGSRDGTWVDRRWGIPGSTIELSDDAC